MPIVPSFPSGMESINYVYTTQQEVEVFISQLGAVAFSDDNKDGIAEINVWATMAVYATREVDLYCNRFYDPSGLFPSYLVHEWGTVICCYRVCKRRNNPSPEGLQDDYNETISRLEEVRDGKLKIPGVPVRNTRQPVMSNMSINDWFPYAKVRRDPITSVGPATPTSFTDPAPAYLYGWPGFTGYLGP